MHFCRFDNHVSEGRRISNFFKQNKKVEETSTPIEKEPQEIVSLDNELTQKGIQSILREKGFNLSQSSISRKLKRMNIGRKKLKLLPDIDSAEQRVVPQRYVTVIKEIPDEKIFFLDETGFNLHTTGSYGYSPLHLPAIRKVSKSRGKNISMIALISNKKIGRYRFEGGAINAKSYLEFLKELFFNEIIKE